MRKNNILGIIYANVHDDLLPSLTEKRSMGSLPFAGRYRLIDFSLSNLTNAGISQVGIITKENYQSLLDHVNNGKAWDLDRKEGGLYILPPFSSVGAVTGVYRGHLDALAGALNFLKRAKQEYVVICDSDVISNVDITDMFNEHIKSGADFTIAYRHGKLPKNHEDIMVFSFGQDQKVTKIDFPKETENVDYSLDITIMKREFLIDLVKNSVAEGKTSVSKHILGSGVDKYDIRGYKVEGFAEVMDSRKTYYNLNMKMLDNKVRKTLFNPERPVYTKSHDRMPTKYGLSCKVENSLIADGCVINGTVKNSVIFRNVKIEEGAVVENAIIMQNAVIKKDAKVDYAIMDKISVVEEGKELKGTRNKIEFLGKGKVIGG